MSACMCMVFGRALWDDPFKEKFFADPVAVCRIYEGPTTEAKGLRALTREDFRVLDEQIKSIRTALGQETMRELAGNFGLQFILGRAMIDQEFAKRLEHHAAAVVDELLGTTPGARSTVAIFETKGFRELNGFAKQRQALRAAGERFTSGVAHGRALAAHRA